MNFKTPLKRRLAKSDRYWTRPDIQLRGANEYRARNGLPLLTSPDQITRHGRRPRDSKGRFLSA